MKKIAISLVLLLLLNLCGCSILPVGTNISNIETLKSWSFQYNEGTNDYSVFFALLTDTERYVSADVDADIRIVNENGEEVYKGTHSVSKKDFGYYSSQAAGEQYLANIKIACCAFIIRHLLSSSIQFRIPVLPQVPGLPCSAGIPG